MRDLPTLKDLLVYAGSWTGSKTFFALAFSQEYNTVTKIYRLPAFFFERNLNASKTHLLRT